MLAINLNIFFILILVLIFLLISKVNTNYKQTQKKCILNYNIIDCFKKKQNRNIYMSIKYI